MRAKLNLQAREAHVEQVARHHNTSSMLQQAEVILRVVQQYLEGWVLHLSGENPHNRSHLQGCG